MSATTIWSSQNEISQNYSELIGSMRQSNPVHLNMFGDLVVMDYKNVKRVFSDSENFRNFDFTERFRIVSAIANNDPALLEFGESLRYWLLFMNGDRHAEHRRFVNKKFYEADYEKITRNAIQEVLNIYGDRQEADLVEIARKFSFLIISKIINLESSDYDFIQKFSYVITLIFEKTLSVKDLLECANMSRQFTSYLSQTLSRHEKDLTRSLLLEMNEIMGTSRIHELISTWEFLVNAATETTTLLLTRSIATLIDNKDKEINWNSHMECAIAVEELIRFVSPVNWIPRQIHQAMEFEGLSLNKGKTVLVGIASANRDPAVFQDPDTFMPTRKPNPHIGFGFGIHHCVGARLSRFEMQKFLPAFMSAFPSIRLNPAKLCEWDTKVFFRGYRSLPVLLR
ncbi:Polyketide biosynthesis cytochrome P450 PksS [Dyadobacter sp. CECT 9623]|uniref:Polyketide biosynthesis cytochrome P450 PksS n=1 Tax=Dyadobacter linearis TaxID=2823330 RepID=A0ABM8UX94_9BACT|nr:cytochrome P450 [Dyadobacter sp. CECT 9623]CAG5073153.1 Polyketide biosynthesis cytochrome P450 PksS [Dyadobacter sp. CECT 9623]